MLFVPFAQGFIVGFRFKEYAADSCYFCHSRLLSSFNFLPREMLTLDRSAAGHRSSSRVEGENVLIEHALKQTNIAVAILHNQPILRSISCESCKTQLLDAYRLS